MNIIELFAIVVVPLAGGLYIGWLLGVQFGRPFFFLGLVLGVPLIWVAEWGLSRLLLGVPNIVPPACRHCGSNDYEVKRMEPQSRWGYVCRRCGAVYTRNRGRFEEVLPDGSTRRYMRAKYYGGWVEDEPGDGPSERP